MWKQILYLSWLVAAGCSDIADREYPEPQPAPAATTDSQATVQTRNLLGNLRSIAENGGTLFGHQCSSLYGIRLVGRCRPLGREEYLRRLSRNDGLGSGPDRIV